MNLQAVSESTTAFWSSAILMILALPLKVKRSVATGLRRISWLIGIGAQVAAAPGGQGIGQGHAVGAPGIVGRQFQPLDGHGGFARAAWTRAKLRAPRPSSRPRSSAAVPISGYQVEQVRGEVDVAGEFAVTGQGGGGGDGVQAQVVAQGVGGHHQVQVRVADQGGKVGHGLEFRHGGAGASPRFWRSSCSGCGSPCSRTSPAGRPPCRRGRSARRPGRNGSAGSCRWASSAAHP